jgi:predicted DNA-binding transcriptional regulator AlpA
MEFDRRVYRREFTEVLGCGVTWFRALEKRGTIPQGKRDPGGKKVWWQASEVKATLDKLANDAERAA